VLRVLSGLPAATPKVVEVVVGHRVGSGPNVRAPAPAAGVLLDEGYLAAVDTDRVEDLPTIQGIENLLERPPLLSSVRIAAGANGDDVGVRGRLVVGLLVGADDSMLGHGLFSLRTMS
jgi:hypothetical protein